MSIRNRSILSLLSLGTLAALVVACGPSAPPPVPPTVEPPAPSAMASAATPETPPPPVAPPAAPAVKTGPVPASPQMKSFKIGAFTVVALRDATFVAANDNKVIGVGLTPDAVAAELKKAGLPEDRIELNVGALLVKDGKHIVLLDSGLGEGPKGALVESLKLAGVAPADVTDVLITHSHFDHVGGLVTGEGKLTYPKATIRMSNKEWTALKANADLAKLVAVITPKVKGFEPGTEVVPGITAVELYGHTPGHLGYEVKSGKERIMDVGDLAHSSVLSLVKPEWKMGFDGDSALAIKVRRERLEKLAKDKELVFAPHFPFPSVGYVSAQDGAFAWKGQVPGE
jgi:glyoxylase-like metal-dependent hydrolase (beta-lactamase superfamily II)